MRAALRQTWQISLRHLRVFVRQPAFLGITLTQPIIWLLLFGALFKAVTQIPGFDDSSYIDFLTPGIVVMLAMGGPRTSRATWATSMPTVLSHSPAGNRGLPRLAARWCPTSAWRNCCKG